MSADTADAAARLWLERLPQAERLAAQAHTDARLLVWLGAGAALILAAMLLARSGLAGRLRAAIERERPRPWLARAAAAAAIVLVLAAVKGAYDVLIAWPVEGVGPAGFAARLAEAVSGAASAVTAAVLVIPGIQALIRRLPRIGPPIVGTLLVAVTLAAGWGPYAFGGGPLAPAPAGSVRDGLLRLIADSGVPARGVWLSPDPAFEADVTGAFGHATVVVGRHTLGWTSPEARAYVGHVMGHYAHADVFIVSLLDGLVAFAALLAIARFAAPLARWLGASGAKDAADPEALPAAAIVAVVAFGVLTLASAGYLRWANVRADAYSLDQAREPDGLAAVLERRWDHESVDPNALERWVFYSHPPLKARLVHAMAWKAAHGG